MQNGTELAKQKANYVTTKSGKDGFIEAIDNIEKGRW